MGPRLSKYNLFLVDRYLEDKDYGRSKEELHPAWIKDRDHLFLILEVKETTHSWKGTPGVRERRGHQTVVYHVIFPETLVLELILAKRCARAHSVGP